jgi:hypothetical protein
MRLALKRIALTAAPYCVLGHIPRGAAVDVATYHVSMSSVQYNPRTVDVHPKDTMDWPSDDVVPYTVTARDRSCDSGSIDIGSR